MTNNDRVCQIRNIDIVGAPDEDDMHKAHTRKQWNDAEGHDLVFAEKSFIANVAAGQPDGYDDSGENGAPPRIQESRVVGEAGSAQRGGIIVQGARCYHAAVEQSPQTLASAEGGAVWKSRAQCRF